MVSKRHKHNVGLVDADREYELSEAVQEFTNLQEKYKTIVHAADGLDLARIKVTSPAAWILRLSLGQWLRALASHQKRHLWQAGKVREAVEGSEVGSRG